MGETMLATSGKTIKLWNPQNYTLYQEITSENGRINGLTWNQDGQCLASLGETGNDIFLSAVNAKSTASIGIVRGVEAPTCIQFASRSPHYLGVGNRNGAVCIWNVKSQVQKKVFSVTDGCISQITFNHSDSHITAASKKGTIFLLSVVNNSTAGPFKIFDNQVVTDLVYSRVKKSLLGCCSEGGSVALFDTHTNKIVHGFNTAHSSPVASVSFSPVNELLMISVGYDKKFACYNVHTKQTLMTHRSSAPLTSAAFLAGGQQIALGTMTGQVFVHDLRALRPPIATIMAHSTAVTNILLQPSSRSMSESLVGSYIKKASGANSADAIQSTTCLKPSKSCSGQPNEPSSNYRPKSCPSSTTEVLSPDVFSPIRPTEHDTEVNLVHVMQNQANRDVLSPSESLSIHDVLSPVRPIDQTKIKNSPITQKLLSHDIHKDDVLSPIRSTYSNSGACSFQDQGLTVSHVSLHVDDEAPVYPFSQKNKENVEPVSATRQYHDGEMEKDAIDSKCSSSRVMSHKTDSIAQVFSPLHKNDHPKNATSNCSVINICDARSSTHSTDETTKHLAAMENLFHPRTGTPEKQSLMKPLQTSDLMPEVLEGVGSADQLNISLSTVKSSDRVKSEGNGVSQLQVELIRSCMTEILEEFQDDVNRRLMHLQYVMTKQFLKQQEVMGQLHRQYSLNEDLLQENERLRQEISHLKAKY
ncbi:protein NEDD1 [Panulirus ornatus]|uniref:protein NEDD1 n=1 Tax=Panulirus ornatus TaxID=150431 RepID=UPI003A8C2576